MAEVTLPAGVQVFERGWLSSNNVLFIGQDSCALVDSGYCTHSGQTLELVDAALEQRPLDLLLNTHLHSDHCGGNAALQHFYPRIRTHIPPGQAPLVSVWDADALTYVPTGQLCPRFKYDALLVPGTEIRLADRPWQILAAPGHDPHSIILFEAQSRTLISADALWQNGFGVVFPEIEGEHAFDEVAATLDLIQKLEPRWVIPGHGPVFQYSAEVLSRSRERLSAFVQDPARHAHHAAKVLLKFKLLEQQQLPYSDFVDWAKSLRYFQLIRERFFLTTPMEDWIALLTGELVRSKVANRSDALIFNA
ncbi:MBL fold metallo-hydrolase [Polaromonas sp.]|uniref:MBL fold metallo-hydrolase n=1 Tax=Polaromonas sp. TaxID=1869339 RepID=UPI003C935322